jgi:hypothetical protein
VEVDVLEAGTSWPGSRLPEPPPAWAAPSPGGTRSQVSPQTEHVYLSAFGDLQADGEGLSPDRPVPIFAATSVVGVPAEYDYLRRRFGEMGTAWTVDMRSRFVNDRGRTVETFHLLLKDGSKVDVHFDVTSFYQS